MNNTLKNLLETIATSLGAGGGGWAVVKQTML